MTHRTGADAPTPAASAHGASRTSDPDVRASVAAWEALFRAQVTLVRRFARHDVWGGRSMGEYDVLFTLAGAPGHVLRLRDLARSSLLTQPSLSRLVERLEAQGLVARERVEGDRRGTAVRLTAAGLERQRDIGRRHARSIDALVGGALDAEELATLERLCTKLRLAQDDLPDPVALTGGTGEV